MPLDPNDVIPIDAAQDKELRKLVVQNSHRIPDEVMQKTLHTVRQRFLDLSVALTMLLPASRELSCALTKLDEARMWACNAATLNGEIKDVLWVNRVTPIGAGGKP